MTEGRGADVCIDAVGMEAERGVSNKLGNVVHLQACTINAVRMCFSAVRRSGHVAMAGVYAFSYDNFPIGQAFDKGVKLSMGQAPVHFYVDELIRCVEEGKIELDDIITHPMPLTGVAEAYDMVKLKKDGYLKVVLRATQSWRNLGSANANTLSGAVWPDAKAALELAPRDSCGRVPHTPPGGFDAGQPAPRTPSCPNWGWTDRR